MALNSLCSTYQSADITSAKAFPTFFRWCARFEAGDIDSYCRKLTSYKLQILLILKIRQNLSLVIIGETACGKSTQIPQYIYDAKINLDKLIGCTQPRRVATTSIATWVAQMKEISVGNLVGYSVRFEDATSDQTKIKYMTDGILLREALKDPLLSTYSVIIIDEVHERSLRTDILLSIVKSAQFVRNSPMKNQNEANLSLLRVIVMSATMDVDKFSKFFNDCPVIYIEGQRLHPIKLYYPSNHGGDNHNSNIRRAGNPFNEGDYVRNALVTLFQIHEAQAPGDILIFMPGKEEIETFIRQAKKIIKEETERKDCVIPYSYQVQLSTSLRFFPFYAGLPKEYQNKIFDANENDYNENVAIISSQKGQKCRIPRRKVIVATNVAETSITIPGIRFVIDTGKFKTKKLIDLSTKDYSEGINNQNGESTSTHDTRFLRECLTTDWISQDQAWQRTGRAGRDPYISQYSTTNGCNSGDDSCNCYRLYFENNPVTSKRQHLIPELTRCDLTSILPAILHISSQIHDSRFAVNSLQLIDDPPFKHILHALDKLSDLGILRLKTIDKDCISGESKLSRVFCKAYQETIESALSNQQQNATHSALALACSPSLFVLTPLGLQCNLLPLDPVLSKILLKSPSGQCSDEIISLVSILSAMTESGNIAISRSSFNTFESNSSHKASRHFKFSNDFQSDHLNLLRTYQAYKSNCGNKKWCLINKLNRKVLLLAFKIDKQLRRIAKGLNMPIISCGQDTWKIRKTLLEGLFNDCAFLHKGTHKYELLSLHDNSWTQKLTLLNQNIVLPACSNNSNPILYIHPTSALFISKPRLIVFSDLLVTNKPYMKIISAIEPEWLKEISEKS
ncbi:ATP-dependent RNA helicase DHX33-like [Gordionus sp. m RMFG-2023]|uniref:ATP-dependent RNA helicase DHX33-like n=1 Tax=Gordionus sp. m RMFG-2023 TaxID=3053472 RepID=UPI0031FDA8C6